MHHQKSTAGWQLCTLLMDVLEQSSFDKCKFCRRNLKFWRMLIFSFSIKSFFLSFLWSQIAIRQWLIDYENYNPGVISFYFVFFILFNIIDHPIIFWPAAQFWQFLITNETMAIFSMLHRIIFLPCIISSKRDKWPNYFPHLCC